MLNPTPLRYSPPRSLAKLTQAQQCEGQERGVPAHKLVGLGMGLDVSESNQVKLGKTENART